MLLTWFCIRRFDVIMGASYRSDAGVRDADTFNRGMLLKLRGNVNDFSFVAVQFEFIGCGPRLYVCEA